MAKYIHNVSEETKSYQGRDIEPAAYYLIPDSLDGEYVTDDALIADVTSGSVVIATKDDGSGDLEDVEVGLAYLLNHFSPSLAVDKNNINQFISGTDAVVIETERVLWDVHNNYDIAENDFVIPMDGIYVFDCQVKLKNLANVKSVELAVFKRGEPDDYWFILAKKDIDSETEVQLNAFTSFDFYKDERYCIKLILYKVLPLVGVSCTVDGNDDYTAWGYNFMRSL